MLPTDVGIRGPHLRLHQPRLGGGERQVGSEQAPEGATAGRGLRKGGLHTVLCGGLLLCACPGAGICPVLCPSLCRMYLRLLSLHSFLQS